MIMDIREEASLILGFRLPDDPLKWEPLIKSHTQGTVDQNKKWNMVIMTIMRIKTIEDRLAALEK